MAYGDRSVFAFLAGLAQSLAPFVARVVLCLSFLPPGWAALAGSSQYTPEQTVTLTESLQVDLDVSEDGTSTGESYLLIALRLHERHLPPEVVLARAIAGLQMVGGVLILIGFLSRIVSLAFLAMLAILYLPTDISPEALQTMAQIADADRLEALAHLSAAALCLLIVAQGPGFLSADAVLFGNQGGDSPDALDA